MTDILITQTARDIAEIFGAKPDRYQELKAEDRLEEFARAIEEDVRRECDEE